MVTKRASKRRRTNQNAQPKEVEEEAQPPVTGEVDENSEKSIEKSAKNVNEEELPVVVLAHGAGAPSSSEWMIRWKGMLAKALNAIEVVTFDYPYIAGGKRRAPPKAEKLVDFHCDIVRKTMAKYLGIHWSWLGSRWDQEKDIAASAVVCLGYPLKDKTNAVGILMYIYLVFSFAHFRLGMNGAVRDETLLQLTVPVLFVQGSKDGLCPLEKLEAVRKKMNASTALHVIEGVITLLKLQKASAVYRINQEEAENQAVQAITTFVSSYLRQK
ncbi:hypothetical protein DH2020_005681 [Rehmannia glutinosa]|uniref:KANL3/Tex30 alpha/beta hydrolase-like domain-containing protein n=1 Tax=Rehmannia glutinosa TaxID=99300 RepID=A0ABR0XGS4_REHGL